jgi:hypothetical protein
MKCKKTQIESDMLIKNYEDMKECEVQYEHEYKNKDEDG